MSKILVIGAGGVSSVAIHKMAQLSNDFKEITLASRTIDNCKKIQKQIKKKYNFNINIEELDADNISETSKIISKYTPELVVNLALPYQDLNIMQACLNKNVNYLDTANYEPRDEAKFEYKWQWELNNKFKEKNLMGLLGSGFDPGVTNVYTAYIKKHYLDEIHYLDILDCNGGDHGKAFATNFNPEVNIREITQPGKFWENGSWKETKPLEIHKSIFYPEIGHKESYLMYHEELESLVKNFPTLKRARFWMTFGKEYLTHLKVLENIGMTSIEPINYEGHMIQPLQFLKAILPEPSKLGANYSGETSIGCQITGVKNGEIKTCYIYNNCKHQDAYRDVNGQGVAYTTGVPAMLGAKLMATGVWMRSGVFNVEEMNPDPFMEQIGDYGLPWNVVLNEPLPVNEND